MTFVEKYWKVRLVKKLLVLICAVLVVGCGAKEEEPVASEIGVAPEEGPAPSEVVAAPEDGPGPEPAVIAEESVALPESFPEIIPVMEGMVITSAEVKNADTNEFKVVAKTTEDVDTVFHYYIQAFENGLWTEDMVMTQHGNNQASFIKGNLLVFMDAQSTETGSLVTLSTGTSD